MIGPLDRARDRWFDCRMAFPRLGCVALALALAMPAARAHAQTAAEDMGRRRQLAAELKRQGVEVDWRLASAADLEDWNRRVSEARTLNEGCDMQVDWRTASLADLKDMNARCARAAVLARWGLQVDWKNYSLQQLEGLQAFLRQMRAPRANGAPPVLPAELPPGFDPDAIIIPSYAGPNSGAGQSLDDSILAPGARKGGRE
ncbi:MAG TPA: hypothetical protein VHL80_21835, partial [Polyangia bacterium]|nr:hypothetical protein [Polyangia bacterium]